MSFVGLISGRVRGNTMRDDYAQVSGNERDCKVYGGGYALTWLPPILSVHGRAGRSSKMSQTRTAILGHPATDVSDGLRDVHHFNQPQRLLPFNPPQKTSPPVEKQDIQHLERKVLFPLKATKQDQDQDPAVASCDGEMLFVSGRMHLFDKQSEFRLPDSAERGTLCSGDSTLGVLFTESPLQILQQRLKLPHVQP